MALAAFALTTLSSLKEELGIASADTSKDSRLERIIQRATAEIERRTERKMKARRYNDGASTHTTTTVPDEDYIYFSGALKDEGGETLKTPRGYGEFYLPAWPVRANDETGSVTFGLHVLSNRSSDNGDEWDESSLVEFDHFIVDRENGILRLLTGRFASGETNYRITCAAGFLESAAPYVPGDLEDLCILLCKRMYRDDAGLMSEKIGTWSRTFDVAKAKERIEEGISLFRRWSI